jgi:transposase
MREQAHKLFRSIHALSKKGMKNAQIAQTLGIHRHTVEKYLAFKASPQRRHFTKRRSAPSHLTKTTHLKAVQRRLSQRHAHTQGDLRARRLSRCLPENVVRISRYLKEQEVLGEPLPDT